MQRYHLTILSSISKCFSPMLHLTCLLGYFPAGCLHQTVTCLPYLGLFAWFALYNQSIRWFHCRHPEVPSLTLLAAHPVAAPLKPTSPPSSELGGGFSRNSSIRLSDKRSRISMRGSKAPPPTLPSFGEIPSVAGTRSSGFGSEDSFTDSAAVSPRSADLAGKLRVPVLLTAHSSVFLAFVKRSPHC